MSEYEAEVARWLLGLIVVLGLVVLSPFLVGGTMFLAFQGMRQRSIRKAKEREAKRAMRDARQAMPAPSESIEHSTKRKEPPPRGWLIDRLVPLGPTPRWRWRLRGISRARPIFWQQVKGYVTAVLGSGGVGKSYLLADGAVAAVTGSTWLGQKIMKLKNVLYVDTELDAETFWSRVFMVCRGRKIDVPEGIHYLRLYASLGSFDGLMAIRNAAIAAKAQAIFVDSMTIGAWGVAPGDHNTWRMIYTWFESYGVPIVLIDHLGKDADKGAFGSFMKQAMVRSVLLLMRDANDATLVQVSQEKTNFGEEHPAFAFRKVFTPSSVVFLPTTADVEVAEAELPEEPDPFRVHVEGWVPNGRREAPAPTPVEDPLALLGGS